ncbi:heparanase-like [Dermacentor albipictus]|uniref:heparanase-like n=1 Tax=Dermacentor albipictus TaxID=60249 RepID=UPI0031FC3E83
MPHRESTKGVRQPSAARKSASKASKPEEEAAVSTVQAVGHISLLLLCLAALGVSCYAFYLYYVLPVLWTPSNAARYYQDAPWLPSGESVQGARRVCNFSVDLGAPAHIVDERFVSFNLDAALFRRSWDWLELDLENPRLLALCRSLAPSLLRVGGTTSNLLLFTEKNRTAPDPVRDWQNNLLYPEYKGPLVMHGDDWIRLNTFVNAVGWELLFSLNGLNRRSGAWDSSNAVRLLRFSDLLKLKVHWQLGSELEATGLVHADELARDYGALRHLLLFWPAKGHLVGPDIGDTSPEALAFLDSFIEDAYKSIDAVTFHHYHHRHPAGTVADILNGTTLRGLSDSIQQLWSVLRRNGLRKSLWITEAASAAGDGLLAISDTYASSLVWLDTLGTAARQGVSVVFRQDLVQGNNRLLADDEFRPLPDYWISLVHKRLVGSRALQLRTQPRDDAVRLYAHCLRDGAIKGHRGAVIVFGLNLSNETAVLTPKDPELQASHVMAYAVEPDPAGNLVAEDVVLNGRPLVLSESLRFPDIVPAVLHPRQPMAIGAYSMAFFVFADYKAPACTGTF